MKHCFLLLILLSFIAPAQDLPIKPSNYITDAADVLSDDEESSLNSKLHSFEDSTSNQIFIYTAASLNGNAIDDFSQKLFHAWRIGQAEKNNGVLITIFVDDHKFRIQTGYGLEGALPDLLTKHIQDNDMRPSFKQNNYYEGIDKGVDKLIYYSKHEFNPSDLEESHSGDHVGLFVFFYAFSAVFLIIILLLAKRLNDRPTAKKVLTIISILFFVIPFVGAFLNLIMVFIALSFRKDLLKSSGISGYSYDSSSSSYSSDSSSSWSSSDSSSDSDFSGGGGGDSGGGGSSSDW